MTVLVENTFIEQSDFFIAFPWASWTLLEVLDTSQALKEDNKGFGSIIIPSYNTRVKDYILGSKADWFLQEEDMKRYRIVDRISEIEL